MLRFATVRAALGEAGRAGVLCWGGICVKKCRKFRQRLLSGLLAALLTMTSAGGGLSFAGTPEGNPAGEGTPAAGETSVGIAWTPDPDRAETGGEAVIRLAADAGAAVPSAEFAVALTEAEAQALRANFERETDDAPLTFTPAEGGVTLTLEQSGEDAWRLGFTLAGGGSADAELAVDTAAPVVIDVTEDDIAVACYDAQGEPLAEDAVSVAKETSALTVAEPAPDPAGTVKVTAYAPALTVTLSAPADMTLPAPVLSVSLDGGEAQALTADMLAQFGLTAMPQPAADTSASTSFECIAVYSAAENTLPASFTVADGEDGVQEHTAVWSLVPQQAEGCTLVEEDGIWHYIVPDEPQTQAAGDETIQITEKNQTAMTRNVFWVDNSDEDGKRPNDFGTLAELWFKIGDGEYTKLTAENLSSVGLSAMPAVTYTETGVGTGQISVAENTLPVTIQPMIELTDGTLTENGEPSDVSWELRQPEVLGYDAVEVTDDNAGQYTSVGDKRGWFYVIQDTFRMNLQAYSGTTELTGLKEAVIKQLQFNIDWTAGGESKTQVYLFSAIEPEHFSWTQKGTVCEIVIDSVWRYNLDGSRMTYSVSEIPDTQDPDTGASVPDMALKLEDGVLDEGDSLVISYDNSGVAITGGMTDMDSVVYNGGTMKLTLTGTKTYTATKAWRDAADNTARPEGELQLWRYRAGQSYTTAAPLRDGKGRLVTLALDPTRDSYSFTFEVDFDGDGTEQDDILPKYDAEGYEYIYVVREYLDGTTASGEQANAYEQVFGRVNADGTMDDFVLVPDADGNLVQSTREAGNTFLYNGGTLSNHLAGLVSVPVTKQWKASSYQTEFSDVEVTVSLQSRIKGSNDEWKDTGTELTLKDFRSEILAVSDSELAPRYDLFGNELEYRWVETAVTKDGVQAPYTDTDEGRVFTLTQEGRQVEYLSTPTIEADGSTFIVNSIANTLNYTVEKLWRDENGNDIGGQIQDPVEFTLYRAVSGEKMQAILKITQDGQTDAVYTEAIRGAETVTVEETGTWKTVIKDLAEYDAEGRRYEYLLFETKGYRDYVPNFTTTIDPDTGDYFTIVTNAPGAGVRILVHKEWVDDSDVQHRESVTITAFSKKDGEEGRKLTSVTLGNNVWTDWLNLPGGYTEDDVYLLETKVGAADIPLQEYIYGVTTDAPVYDVPAEPNLVDSEGDPDYTQIQYETENHRYEATYSWQTFTDFDEQVYTVTNRRLGAIELTVTKVWNDGENENNVRANLKKALDDAGLTLALRLDFIEADQDGVQNGDYKINYTAGTVTISPNNIAQITDDQGNRTGAVQPIDFSADTSKYYFFSLPKYDVNGTSVRYTVEEVFLDASGKEVDPEDYPEVSKYWAQYAVSVTEGDYRINDTHTLDEQAIQVTNSLAGVKDIQWHLVWKDEYIYQSGQRPDVYLDIYRVVHEKQADGTVDEKTELIYKDYRWTYQENDGTDPEKHWMVTLPGMPKYDSLGYEIFYYAIEKTNVNAGDFSYRPPRYSSLTDGSDSEDPEFGASDDPKDAAIERGDVLDKVYYDRYPLKEGNTFINTIAGAAVAEGRKLWTNWPGGVSKEDMPAVTFTLTQTDADGHETPDYASVTVQANEWSGLYSNGAYAFEIAYTGKNVLAGGEAQPAPGNTSAVQLPRFDTEGRLYTYQFEEGDVTWPKNPTGPDAEDVFDAVINGSTITNNYDSAHGSLTVTKYLEVPETAQGIDWDNMQFPEITFALYRTYAKNDGAASGETLVASKTWPADEVKAAVKAAAAAGGTGGTSGTVIVEHCFTFDALDLYAPNGSSFQYTVKETSSLGGYKTYAVASAVEKEKINTDLQLGANLTADRELEVTLTKDDTAAATFLNTYDQERTPVSLTGTKEWDDFSDAFDLRPAGITLTVSRRTTGIAEQRLTETDYTVTWDKTTDTDNWTYTITGAVGGTELERFAPDGKPWTYIVKETMPSGNTYYTVTQSSGSVSQSASQADDAGTVAMPDLTNRLKTSCTFNKTWEDKDGNVLTEDMYGIDFTVSFKLQVQEAGGSWQDADTYFASNLAPDVYAKIFNTPAPYAFTESKSAHIGTTNGWRYVFRNLPTYIKKAGGSTSGKLAYRAVETEVKYGDVTQPVKIGDTGYTIVQDGMVSEAVLSATGTTSTTTNTLKTQEFTVTKTWKNDADNAYGTRPSTVNPEAQWETSFVIEYSTDNGTSWTPVTVRASDGTTLPLTVTLYGLNKNATVSEEITGLPTMIADAAGTLKECVYRARELQPGWTTETVKDKTDVVDNGGAYNTAYTVEYTDTLTSGANATTAENSAEPIEFEAEKAWNPGTPSKNVTLSLQYLDKNGKGTTLASVTLNGEADRNSTLPYYENEAWHAVWTEVPASLPGSTLDGSGKTQYQIVESMPTGFLLESEKEIDGVLTFTNVESVVLSVEKFWGGIASATAPEVTVALLRDGVQVSKVTLTNATKWKASFPAQPKYDETGKEYVYSVVETKVGTVEVNGAESIEYKGETVLISYDDRNGNNFVIRNIGTKDISGTKTWLDDSDAYDTRPENLELELTRVISGGRPEVVSATPAWTKTGNVWRYVYRDLPATDRNGNAYTYTVTEKVPAGYAPTKTGNNFTNLLTGKVDVPFTKIWRDNSNADGSRPDSVTFVLYADGVATSRMITLQKGLIQSIFSPNEWSGEFKDLPEYDSTGHRIEYTVREQTVPDGYDVRYEDGGIVNVRFGNLTVKKTVSGTNAELNRAFEFRVTLSDTSVNGRYGDLTFANGVAEFTLKDGESVSVTGLSADTGYAVEELSANKEGYTTIAKGEKGTIPAGDTAKAEFTNHRDGDAIQTGDTARPEAFMALAALSALGMAGLVLFARRRARGH